MLRYFILCASLLYAYFFCPTWVVVVQALCVVGLVVSDILLHMARVLKDEDQRVRREYVNQLNPHKWGK